MPCSLVGIATDYGPRSNPGRDDIFRPSRRALGPTPSFTMSTGSFPGVKCGRGVLLTTQTLRAAVIEEYSYTCTHPLGHTAHVTGTVPLPFKSSSLYLCVSNRTQTFCIEYQFLITECGCHDDGSSKNCSNACVLIAVLLAFTS